MLADYQCLQKSNELFCEVKVVVRTQLPLYLNYPLSGYAKPTLMIDTGYKAAPLEHHHSH